MGQENEIVFEDLHGVNEDEPVTIDLDAGSKDDGIARAPADDAADDDNGNDDGNDLDDLRSADDADGDDDKDDAAIKPSEDDDYSKKVKARIDRERRAKRKAQQESDYWKQQAEKLAKDSSTQSRETTKRVIEQATSQIESTQAQLEAAIEAGNTKDQVRLMGELTDRKAEKIQAELSLQDLSESGNVQPFDDKVVTQKPKKSQADNWVDERSDWYGAKGFERQTRLANRLDKEVYADGYDPDTPEYFEELDRRLKEKEPTLFDDGADDADEKPVKRKPAQSAVAGVTQADSRRQRSSGSKIELDERDFANMRRFNLNVNDPEVLKEYARNKREAGSGGRS